jgi:recombination protein RecT
MTSSPNALVAFEQQLKPMAPHFAQALGALMPVERLMRTVVVSVERLPKLLECNRQSLFNAAMSAAVLGLEVDGVTGQAFLIPFKGRAQLVIGYKGFNTLAARAGLTVTGSTVREGDVFDYDLAEGWITHKPVLGNKGRIIAAWAKAASASRPPVVAVMGIDDLLAVKARSPAVKGGAETPWNDPHIGFPAMCEKTVKRRLARSLPLSTMQLAARLDEAVDEQGKSAWLSPDKGAVIEGEFSPIGEIEPNPTPSAADLIGTSSPRSGLDGPAAAPDDRLAQLDAVLAEAAEHGLLRLQQEWSGLHPADQKRLKPALDRRHKPRAQEVEAMAQEENLLPRRGEERPEG